MEQEVLAWFIPLKSINVLRKFHCNLLLRDYEIYCM